MQWNTAPQRPNPSGFVPDALTDVIRNGARKLIEQAIHAELGALMVAFSEEKLDDGRARLVRHGHLPKREVLTRAKRDGLSISLDTSANDDSTDDAFDGRGRWRDMPEIWDEMTPERIVDGRNILEHVGAAIDQLPPAQRAVLVLRGQQDLDADEVCEILGITAGNMRVLLHRARLSLRQSLDRIGG